MSVIPPGDVGLVSTFGFTRGRETEAASSGEHLPDPQKSYIYLAVSSALSSLGLTPVFFFFLISLTGASPVSGEPVVERRAGRGTAAPPRQGAGGGHTRGAEQAPAVHVLHQEI